MKKVISIVLFSIIAVCLFASGTTEANDAYPTRNIRLILGSGSGGAVETVCREWQPFVEKNLGVAFEFDFISGAGGVIAGQTTANADPDGYTILLNATTNAVNQTLIQGATYDIDSFDYIGQFTTDPGVILVNKNSNWYDLEGFLDYVKSQPKGTVRVSVADITDVNYLALKEIESVAGVEFNIVSYGSGSKARLAVVSGEVEASCCNWFGAASVWDDTRAITVMQDENTVPALAGIKTTSETLGQKMHVIDTCYFICTPAGFREKYPERFETLKNAFQKAWNDPEFLAARAAAGKEGYITVYSPEETEATLREVYDYVKANLSLFEVK